MRDRVACARQTVRSFGVTIAAASLLVFSGCEVNSARESRSRTVDYAAGDAPAAALSAAPVKRPGAMGGSGMMAGMAGGMPGMAGGMPGMAPAESEMPGAETQADIPVVPRKIVYNASVSLVVENLSNVETEFARLVREAGGYISESDISSQTASQRRATWKVRVPVERFDPFVAAVARLGELQQNKVDSQDVTQEFYDIEARIANKQQEEKRLLKHLADSTGKLTDILAVERELTRVRGEIEQAQGRNRFLSNVSALSTVTLTAIEIKNYTPPVAPTFATEIARTFAASVERLTDFAKDVILFVVAVAPWLPVILVSLIVLYWLSKRLWAARHARIF